MNIDIECIGLLSLILQDSPKDRQYILCILARSNSIPAKIVFHHNTEYPTFYGYSNGRIPLYLMGKGVLSNVPREGYSKRLMSSYYLSYSEVLINGAASWSLQQKLTSVAKFITLDNKTAYKDAEVFLMFKDKASNYIKDYSIIHKDEISSFLGLNAGSGFAITETVEKKQSQLTEIKWDESYRWDGDCFFFGNYGKISFKSKDRQRIFKTLTEKKGSWATVGELKASKDAGFVRATIKQIEDRFPPEARKHVKIASTLEDDSSEKPKEGAYKLVLL